MHKRHKWQFAGYVLQLKENRRKLEFVCHCGKTKQVFEK